jgi:hypothetical protein
LPVDVTTETAIDRPADAVAAFAAAPDNATQWYANIRAVSWRTASLLAIGTPNRKDLAKLKAILERG